MYPVTIQRSSLRLAHRVRRTLTDHNVDYVSLDWLSRVLDVTEPELYLATATTPHLGIHRGPAPTVYCLPPQPVAAGFEVRQDTGRRLLLRLPGRGPRPPLVITGQRVGPEPAGAGELAYTVRRLTQMAANWLPDPGILFELVAEAWRHAETTHPGGGVWLHRADFAEAITADGSTNRLELVTNRRWGAHQLANVYPVPVQ